MNLSKECKGMLNFSTWSLENFKMSNSRSITIDDIFATVDSTIDVSKLFALGHTSIEVKLKANLAIERLSAKDGEEDKL